MIENPLDVSVTIRGYFVRVYAVLASRTAVSDSLQARKLGRASIGLSISGIVISVVTVVILIFVAFITVGSRRPRGEGRVRGCVNLC